MGQLLSKRLAELVDALPLYDGIRVLEIGCGPGAAARELARRIGKGYVLAIDRSAAAISKALRHPSAGMRSGLLTFRQSAVEDFELAPGEQPFDLAFAVRVGALDGRHPEAGHLALQKIAKALAINGKLYIDGGNPLKEIELDR